MAIYDFKCVKCDHIDRDIVMSIAHTKGEIPKHCGEFMSYHISSPPMVIWKDPIIQPFRATGTKDAPIITSTKQNREYMARNDLVDANDLYSPPTHAEQQAAREEAKESIKAITPTAEQAEQLKKSGLDSILDN